MNKLFFFTLMLLSQIAVAQNEDFRNTISLQSGKSAFTFLRSDLVANDSIAFKSGKIKASPTIQGAFDYGINNWLSVGIAASHNNASVSLEALSIKGRALGDAAVKIARTSLSVRGLVHYSKNEKLDMYSGGRLGVSFWSGKIGAELTDKDFEKIIEYVDSKNVPIPKFILNRLDGVSVRGGFAFPQVQVIPFGMRYYFTEKIGASFETAIGGPYIVAIGGHYRF